MGALFKLKWTWWMRSKNLDYEWKVSDDVTVQVCSRSGNSDVLINLYDNKIIVNKKYWINDNFESLFKVKFVESWQ